MASNPCPPSLTRTAGRVAREGYRGLKEGRRVVVPGSANRVVTWLVRFVPHKILLELTALHQKGRDRQSEN
jgi:short-subunit dehydrogenase